MKTLFDTSVIVAGLIEAHPMHSRAFPWIKQDRDEKLKLVVAAHTIAESYASSQFLTDKAPNIALGGSQAIARKYRIS